jgi:hypothetical protein
MRHATARGFGVTVLGYPMTADDIDAGWLTAALDQRHRGVQVATVEVRERHEVTNAHALLHVTYDEAAGAPPTLFCKLPPVDDRRASIIATGMGQREALFYDSLAAHVSMRVPLAHVARQDDDSGLFVMLLEDLVAAGCQVSDGTWGIGANLAAGALEDLADLHARFFDPARRAAEAAWVPVPRITDSTYGAVMLRYGMENHPDRLTTGFNEIAELYIDHCDALQAIWQEGPKTVIHGDPHIGNLFVDGDRTGFLDWGIIRVSTPLRDVSYFMTMGMSIEDRRAHERDLLRHYLAALEAKGGPAISFDDAWMSHRLHAAYTVPASCQVVTFPENASPRRRLFADAFLARCLAAVEDLEARAALGQHAGI